MTLSRGARELLKLMRWYAARFRHVFPSRAKLAANLKVSTKTIGRWMLELKSMGIVTVTLYGPNPAEYELSQALIKQLDTQESVRALSAQCPLNVRATGPRPYYMSGNRSWSKRRPPYTETPRKPPTIENYIIPGREKALAEYMEEQRLRRGAATA